MASKNIAYESRRIANAEGHPLSIMWFVGVPPSVSSSRNIPWYHEAYDTALARRSQTIRKKTVFDKVFVVRTSKDIDEFTEIIKKEPTISRIRVQPLDEKLLRDKGTLKRIGQLAKSTGSVIVLEGAVLSHAYYQLLSTGATVEVVHPFIGFDERQEFNKLVRDKVPDVIRERGEMITTAALRGEALIKALSEKLVEEAYELLDAKDLNAIVAELADVREVIDSLIAQHGISNADVEKEQTRKRKERGGFVKGIVLVETQNIVPTSKPAGDDQARLEGIDSRRGDTKRVDGAEILKRNERIERRTDRRVLAGVLKIVATASIPVIRDIPWTVETNGERIEGASGRVVKGGVTGSRSGSRWNIEVLVQIDESQPELI